MSKFDGISDELLACYLDGDCTPDEIRLIEEAISTIDDLDTLLLSRSVMRKMEEEMNGLPGFEEGKTVEFDPYVNLRAAGFLGNQETADLPPENGTNPEDDKQDE